MKFAQWWEVQPVEIRDFFMERVGMSRSYVSLILHERRVPGRQMREMIDLIAGQKFTWEGNNVKAEDCTDEA